MAITSSASNPYPYRYLEKQSETFSKIERTFISEVNTISLHFFITRRILIVRIRGYKDFSLIATSGRGACMNKINCIHIRNEGPIPTGKFFLDPNKINDPNWFRDLGTFVKGQDWGDWRVPLKPDMRTDTFGRNGFYLHGGKVLGSAGCIDIGGGIFGNKDTNKLLKTLKKSKFIIPLFVEK